MVLTSIETGLLNSINANNYNLEQKLLSVEKAIISHFLALLFFQSTNLW